MTDKLRVRVRALALTDPEQAAFLLQNESDRLEEWSIQLDEQQRRLPKELEARQADVMRACDAQIAEATRQQSAADEATKASEALASEVSESMGRLAALTQNVSQREARLSEAQQSVSDATHALHEQEIALRAEEAYHRTRMKNEQALLTNERQQFVEWVANQQTAYREGIELILAKREACARETVESDQRRQNADALYAEADTILKRLQGEIATRIASVETRETTALQQERAIREREQIVEQKSLEQTQYQARLDHQADDLKRQQQHLDEVNARLVIREAACEKTEARVRLLAEAHAVTDAATPG